jgi:hypothetical protein
MNLRKLFGLKKSRKYPIQRDWYGKSLRKRCFEAFDEGERPVQVARELKAKETTVFRYFQQWNKVGPTFEKQLTYIKGLLAKDSPSQGRMLEFFSDICGVTVEEFQAILSTPHGLRRLLTRTLPLPVYKDIADKRVMALDIATVIQEHLVKPQGSYEDVLYAFNHLMKKSQIHRQKVDSSIEQQNREIEIVQKLQKAAFEEQQARPKPHPLLIRRAQAEMNQIRAAKLEDAILSYWWRKAELMMGGLTPEQAREKMTQILTDGYDFKRAQIMKGLQNKIDPK